MAKARMLSIKAGSDPDLNSISIEAELVFLLAIPHLDRDGLIGGDPIPLWAKVVPRRVELMDKMARIIQEWAAHGLVVRYEWKDGAILFFPGFRKHNQNLAYEREPDSEFPPPPDWHRDEQGRGLIPDEPELAGRLSQNYDKRSSYHAALTEANKEGLRPASERVKIGKTSGSRRDNIPRKNEYEIEDESENESEVEEMNERTPDSFIHSPTDEEIELDDCIDLLTAPEVGLDEPAARKLARLADFDATLRHIFAWLAERDKGGKYGSSGALITRITSKFSAPALTSEQKHSELYLRFHELSYKTGDYIRTHRDYAEPRP